MPRHSASAPRSAWGFFTAATFSASFGLFAGPAGAAEAVGGAAGWGAAAGGEPAFLWNSFFAGVRTSPRLSGDQPWDTDVELAAPRRSEPALPTDFYLGYQKKLDGVTFGATALYVAYPATRDGSFGSDVSQSSYWKFKAGASADVIGGMQLGVNVRYTPDTYGQTGDALRLDGPGQDFSVFAHNVLARGGPGAPGVGGYPTSASDGSSEDFAYDVGVSFNLPYQSKVDLRYYRTIEGPMAVCAGGSCPTYFAAALQTRF